MITRARIPVGSSSKAQRSTRAARSLLAASLLVLAPSCATTALWNEPESEIYDDESGSFNFEPRVDDAGDLLLKVVLTPFTLAFDICTSPLQVLLFEETPIPSSRVSAAGTSPTDPRAGAAWDESARRDGRLSDPRRGRRRPAAPRTPGTAADDQNQKVVWTYPKRASFGLTASGAVFAKVPAAWYAAPTSNRRPLGTRS